jgi:hypothetical protein
MAGDDGLRLLQNARIARETPRPGRLPHRRREPPATGECSLTAVELPVQPRWIVFSRDGAVPAGVRIDSANALEIDFPLF